MHSKNQGALGIVLLVVGCGQSSVGGGAAMGGTSASGGTSATTAGSGNLGGAGAGGSDSGLSGSGGAMMPPTKVNACDGLAAPGVFEEITPPKVKAGIGAKTPDGQTNGGTFAMAVDPVNLGTVYAGTLFQGLWKSTDCGANWTEIPTGTNGTDVNRGMNWTLMMDPTDPNVLYTNSGYGSNGLFKTMDGGVNWTDVWSQKSQPDLAKAFTYNFANVVAIDPGNHLHVLLTFHEPCLAPHPATCIAESVTGGATWKIIDGDPSWSGNEGQVIFFLDKSSNWLWGSQTNGFWRSGDSGQSWTAIPKMTTSHLQSSQLLRTQSGAFFVAAADGIWTSPDGLATDWKLVADTGPIVGGLVSDGTTMYGSTCYFANFCNPRYLRSPETDGQTWTAFKSPTLSQGGNLGYDKAHHLLYSSNLDAGLWRVVVQ